MLSSSPDSPTASHLNGENPINKSIFENDMKGEQDENDNNYGENKKEGTKSLVNHSKRTSSSSLSWWNHLPSLVKVLQCC